MEIGGKNKSIRWASSQSDALAPSLFWGSNHGGAQFVREIVSQPLDTIPKSWVEKTSTDLRPAMGNFFSLEITNDCDGPLHGFGKQFWTLLLARIPALKGLLLGRTPMNSMHYNDRYLRSPFAIALLKEWLQTLNDFPGGVTNKTKVVVQTSILERFDTKQPRLFHHDWIDTQDRKIAFNFLFQQLQQTIFNEEHNTRIPHARELRMTWPDGTIGTFASGPGIGFLASRSQG